MPLNKHMEAFKKYLPFIVVGLSILIIGIFVFRNINKRSSTTNAPLSSTIPAMAQVDPSSAPAPKFNATSFKCSDFNYSPTVSTINSQFDPSKYSWQTAAPRAGVDVVKVNTTAQLGLRNKSGQNTDSLPFIVKVYQPDASINVGRGVLQADKWAEQIFPKDFQSGTTSSKGVYTVIYEIYGVSVACDGFEVVQ